MTKQGNEDGESGCQSFCRGIYNSEAKTFLGRTGSSWAKIGIFYIIYYICLASFFMGMLSVLMYGLLSAEKPYLTGMQSILGVGPGVSVSPRFADENTNSVENTTIHVNVDPDTLLFKRYKNITDSFLKPYQKDNNNHKECDLTQHTRHDPVDSVCNFPLSLLVECENATKHLQEQKNPCVYLKINKIFGWLPDLQDGATTPMIECQGQNAADVENLGEVKYIPSIEFKGKTLGAISHSFFPYLHQSYYESPLIAMTFPNAAKNVIILIKCRVRGIKGDSDTNFEILIDDETTR
jgi:sodium/potassium-transporting ATPase subunit beta